MKRKNTDSHVRAGFFGNVASADAAVRRLIAAGFSKDEIAVICPEQFKDELPKGIHKAAEPGRGTVEGIAAGGALGATLGGLALVAVAVGTAGAALLGAAAVLVGGGAIAGSFSGLILADGYGKGVGEYYEQAVKLGKIVVGVEVEGADSEAHLQTAARILAESGAGFLTPAPV